MIVIVVHVNHHVQQVSVAQDGDSKYQENFEFFIIHLCIVVVIHHSTVPAVVKRIILMVTSVNHHVDQIPVARNGDCEYLLICISIDGSYFNF